MDTMRISSCIMKHLLEKWLEKIIQKKLGSEIAINFPDIIELETREHGNTVAAKVMIDVKMKTEDIFKLIMKED